MPEAEPIEITYELAKPSLLKWAKIFADLSGGRYEIWDLVSEGWIRLQKRKLTDVKFINRAAQCSIIDAIRKMDCIRRRDKKGKWKTTPKPKNIPTADEILDLKESMKSDKELVENSDNVEFLLEHSGLNSKQERAMRLYCLGDLTMQAVGDIMDITESMVSLHIKAARRLMKQKARFSRYQFT